MRTLQHGILAFEDAKNNNIDVINLSVGFSGSGPFHPFVNVANLAVMDGIVVVAAAGNLVDGQINHARFSMPSVRGGHSLTVSGTVWGNEQWFNYDSDSGGMWNRSSVGPESATFFIGPDVAASAYNVSVPRPLLQSGGNYVRRQGTSIAAPIVAGVAALLLQEFPNAAPYEIKARIMNSARPFPYTIDGNDAFRRFHNSVFLYGAGNVYPRRALNSTAFATVTQPVPHGTGSGHGNALLMDAMIPSMNFGNINNSNNTTIRACSHYRITK